MLTLTGCGSLERLRLEAAATEQGRAQAGVSIGDLPADCRKREPHAPLTPGAEARAVLKRERGALDRANDRVDRCAAFHDNLKAELATR